MQPPEMAAFHKILRSRTTLLNYPSKFNLILNSLIPNSRRQNPNFRPIHSSTPNSSSLEPLPQNTRKAWSIYATPPVQPANVVRAVDNDREEGNLLSTPTSSIAPMVLSNDTSNIRDRGEVDIPSNVVDSVVSGSLGGKGKKGKSKVHYVCSNCGHSEGQWWGMCRKCNQQATMTAFVETECEGSVSGFEVSQSIIKRPWLPYQRTGENEPVKLADVSRGVNHMEWRVTLSGLFGLELNRVLGGGLVPGSLILVGGDPGVGKSTLALQMAALIAESCDGGEGGAGPVIYISGEESVDQVGNRADRLNIDTENLYLYSSTDVQDILENVRRLKPRAVVVDSIQTVYLKGVTGSAGGLSQVKECTSSLLCFAKSTNIPFLVIGHVTKSGEIAGPRVLEHIVDVVLYLEGEKHSSHRLLRSVKNRFGSTDELGVFEMSESGLQAVSNPSEMFLSEEHSESEHLAGLAIAVIIDGSRTFLVEVQALCATGPGITRHFNGVHSSRADMILSVLKKQAGLKLGDHSVYLNVINGVSLTETSGDLAMAAAICSSFLEFPLPNNVAFIGEIGLGGELRMVPRIEKRVNTLAKLGFKKCVVPESAKKLLAAVSSEIQIVGCTNLKQVIDKVFRKDVLTINLGLFIHHCIIMSIS